MEILLAPNGKPSNLSPEQYKLVRTPEFLAWFGNWMEDPKNASKVVDDNGEPMICFHATGSDFTIFNEDELGKNVDYGRIGSGFYFTSNLENAKNYERTIKTNNPIVEQTKILECFLNIKNPYIESSFTRLSGDSKKESISYTEKLKRKGFDGVEVELYFSRNYFFKWFVAYNSNQIKLADGSNTTFDPNNPDIRFNGGGGVPTLLAPNGKPSNLNPEQYKLVRSDFFKAFFGDWEKLALAKINDSGIDDVSLKRLEDGVSKIVDDNGEPMIVYYATTHDFNVFSNDEETQRRGVSKEGIFFTDSTFVAETYIHKNHTPTPKQIKSGVFFKENANIMPVFLSLQNPLIVEAGFTNFNAIGENHKHINDFISISKNHNKDGLIVKNVKDLGSAVDFLKDELFATTYIAFEPNQIKSAIGNNGNFDPNNLDIRFDGGGSVNDESETFYERTYADGTKTRFSVEDYEKNIYPNLLLAEGGGDVKGALLAPNGKPTNLSKEQYELVRSKPFISWFGDWLNDPENASKAVDENGEPLVCYHGTDTEFYEFKITDKSRWDVFWFTPNFDSAKMYSEWTKTKTPKVLPCFLNVRKPSKKYPFNVNDYDGFIDYKIDMDYFTFKSINTIQVVQVVNSNQIKLADGTNKTFNRNNPDIRYADGGFVSYKHKYNKKFGYPKYKSHDLKQISRDTRVSLKGLQQIYNKGIGAFKTNPKSVRPTVKSKEQWAMARVYSAVMGGKAAKIDSNELKMKTGGEVPDNYIYVVNNFGSGEVLNKVFNEWKNIQSEKDHTDWSMRVKLLRFGTDGQYNLLYVMEKFDFNKSDKINGILKRDFKKEVQNAYDNKFTFDGGGDVEASDWDNLEERGAAEVTIKLNEFLKANGLNTKVNLSKTSFGRSQYIYATDLTNEFPDESNAVKIRISDHSVSNFDRMFNEVHLDLKNTEYNEALGQYILAKVRFKIGRLRKEYFTHEIVTLPETKRLETTNLTDKDVIISESLTKKGKPMYLVERTNYKRFNQYTYVPTGKIFETIPVDEIEEKRKKERAELAELKERMDNDIEVNDFLRQKYKEGKVVRTLERTYDNLETFKRKHPDYEFIEQRDLGGGAYKYFFMREKDGNNQHTQYDPNYQLWLKENIINKNNEMEKENKTFGGGGGVNTPKNDPNDIYIKAVESITGQGIETDSLRIEGNNVYFKYKNKTYELSLNKKQVDDTISVNRKFLDMRQRYAGGGGVVAKSSHTLNSSKGKIAINLDKKWSDIEILLVPISFLAKCSEFNRRNDPKYSLEDSAKNIENIKKSFVKNGITEPLILSYIKNESKLLLLEGNHRLNALIELEVPYYPVCVTTIDSWAKGKGKGVKTKIKPYFVTEIGRARYTSVDNFEGVPFVNMENNHVDVNETDTLTINVPLLIRLFEYIREDVDNDAQIHFLTENLLKLKNKPELSMIDYDSIIDGVKPKKTAEKILALGGLAEGPPHSEGGIPLVVKSTGQNIEIEGGELVVNKFSSSETEKFEFEGKELTPCEIVSELNSMDNNGVQIDCNKIVGRFKKED